jgi:hypothetical protein
MSTSYYQDKRYCQEFTFEGLPCYRKSERHNGKCDWHVYWAKRQAKLEKKR